MKRNMYRTVGILSGATALAVAAVVEAFAKANGL